MQNRLIDRIWGTWERHIRTEKGLLKPDLIYWQKENPDLARIIDIGITSDNMNHTVPYKDKAKKYDADPVCK